MAPMDAVVDVRPEPYFPTAAEGTTPRRVTILGSTGSIGCNTIDLIARHPGAFEVEALTAQRSVDRLAEQARAVGAKQAVIGDPALYGALKEALAGTETAAAAGAQALIEAAAAPADFVMAGIVGAAGLRPTLAAAAQGTIIGLANKECLVCAGTLMLAEVERGGATLLPVDSEHNAIFQVFDFERSEGVEKIVLTASGGPFREASMETMAQATPEQAVAHPNWDMGAKISVDSATMMNKGLETIEAFYLFPVGAEQIEVLVHPQSVIHSMVAYADGSVLAQLGTPDMRTPIAYYPRLAGPHGGALAPARSCGTRASYLRAAGPGALPRTPARAGSAHPGRQRADRVERRQRDRSQRLPRAPHRLPGDRANGRALSGADQPLRRRRARRCVRDRRCRQGACRALAR